MRWTNETRTRLLWTIWPAAYPAISGGGGYRYTHAGLDHIRVDAMTDTRTEPTEEQKRVIIDHWATHSKPEICEMLGLTAARLKALQNWLVDYHYLPLRKPRLDGRAKAKATMKARRKPKSETRLSPYCERCRRVETCRNKKYYTAHLFHGVRVVEMV